MRKKLCRLEMPQGARNEVGQEAELLRDVPPVWLL